MGIKKMPSYWDYWSSDPTSLDNFISSAMLVNRFDWLFSNIHCNDNHKIPKSGEPGFCKIYKLRPFLDKISQTFLDNYNPTKFMFIDESMIKFKGQSSLKQYMPLKPIKRGYKVWARAVETGYI